MRVNIDTARKRAAAILNRFPAVTVQVTRQTLNEFGENANECEIIGEVKAWKCSQQRMKDGYSVAENAAVYSDEGMIWLSMPQGEALEVQHGDICQINGRRYAIRNIDDKGALLTYWQLGWTGQENGA